MGNIIPIVLIYAVFVFLELPLLKKPGAGRAFYALLMVVNLSISIAALQGVRLPSPSPMFEKMIRALPFLSQQVAP